MIRVISKDLIEINPGEVVEEITVVETFLWMKFQRTYRKVHGNVFRYNKHGYKASCRSNGGCPTCESSRQHKNNKKLTLKQALKQSKEDGKY